MGIGLFGDFSFGNIFQQVSLRMVTHCAGGFVGFILHKRYRAVTVEWGAWLLFAFGLCLV